MPLLESIANILWEVSGGNTRLKTADDIDFQNLKAIAMVCDNGAILPTSGLTKGQWFRHTPTGRDILYQYRTSSWIPLHSFGIMTVYVDATDGGDTLDPVAGVGGGTGVDSDAFATPEFARDTIPGSVGGNVIININDETYATSHTILGKNFTGDYTITYQGTEAIEETEATVNSATAGSRTVNATLTMVGTPYVANEHIGHWVRFEDDTTTVALRGTKHLIYKNTTSVLTMVGAWVGGFGTTPVNTDTFKIVNAGTEISEQLTVTNGQKGIVFDNIYFSDPSASGSIRALKYSSVVAQYCRLNGRAEFSATLELIQTYHDLASPRQLFALDLSKLIFKKVLLNGVNAIGPKIGIDVAALGSFGPTGSPGTTNIIDGDIAGASKNFTDGVLVEGNSMGQFFTGGTVTKAQISNCVDGIHAKDGGKSTLSSTTYVIYTNCTTNNNADDGGVAYSFGKIS